jgi:translation initiation factor 1
MKSKDLLQLMAKKNARQRISGNGATDRPTDRVVYSEFGTAAAAIERAVPDLPPAQQDLRVQVSRKGRKGKSVTIISGFAHKIETLEALAKQLKAQCGSGGTVKGDTIEIQGEHATKLLSLLVDKGYQAKISGQN